MVRMAEREGGSGGVKTKKIPRLALGLAGKVSVSGFIRFKTHE